MNIKDLAGHDLGKHVVSFDENEAILYALAVGASATDTDLVYERDLRVLPTYACALGLWAVKACGAIGAYDPHQSLHANQSLTVHHPLPIKAEIEMVASVSAVWDKVKASLVEIRAASEYFEATYAIFLPGIGGWGGERGPSTDKSELGEANWRGRCVTHANQAALYRLTGDRHPIHIDPDVAKANGFERPILHGLCTLGIVAREVAAAAGAHPCDLRMLSARIAAPVLPGDAIEIAAVADVDAIRFEACVGESGVLKNGRAVFA